jgi:hypothetical protein
MRRSSCDPDRRPTPRALGVEVGEEVELVLRRALSVLPGDRFQDMRTFWAELSRVVGRDEPMAKSSTATPDATIAFDLRRLQPAQVRRSRRNTWRAGVLAATVVSAVTVRADSGSPVRAGAGEAAPLPNASLAATRYAAIADQVVQDRPAVAEPSSTSPTSDEFEGTQVPEQRAGSARLTRSE